MKQLNQKEIDAKLKALNDKWIIKDNSLYQEFRFKNFIQAFSFMTAVAMEAEKANHHPNWENAYNKVKISLFTHSIDGLSEKDFNLAEKIDEIYRRMAPSTVDD
jgi:4a-hydroxytetrahydrobiopterin dehydratase